MQGLLCLVPDPRSPTGKQIIDRYCYKIYIVIINLLVNTFKIVEQFFLLSAILNLKKHLKDIAVEDLTTNTRIGPIFPNLFNLAVLVLNDDNLNALNVPNKKPLQSNVLDMVDALCSNPCSLDTNIQQQVSET